MAELKLARARTIIKAAIAKGRQMELKPLSVVILDAGGNLKAFEREDGASNLRYEIAYGKAYGALGFGVSSRKLTEMAAERPAFVNGLTTAFHGALIPSPGGMLIRDAKGNLLGAIGITGDVGDNDEVAAIAGVEAAKLVAAHD